MTDLQLNRLTTTDKQIILKVRRAESFPQGNKESEDSPPHITAMNAISVVLSQLHIVPSQLHIVTNSRTL